MSKNKEQNDILKGLAHIGCTTSNLDEMIKFYCEILGIENSRTQISDQPYLSKVTGHDNCKLKIGFICPEGGSVPFEIIEYLSPKGGKIDLDFDAIGSGHISWETDNINAAYNRLKNSGVEFLSEPMELNYGLWKNAKGVFFRDPSGLLNQLLEINAEDNGKGRIVSMHHVNYVVNDIDEAIKYLCDSLELELQDKMLNESILISKSGKIDGKFNSAYIKLPKLDFLIELWSFNNDKQLTKPIDSSMIGNVHLCFEVENMMYSYNSLKKQNIIFAGPPAEVTAGVNKGAFAIYMKGVDGIICELFQGAPTKIK